MQHDFSALKDSLPYVKAFRGKTFVIKLGGELCEDPAVLDHLVEQFALLFYVGIPLVIVHGGGKHATALSEKLGVSSEFFAGRRVTSAEMLEVTKMSFAGSLNTDLIALFKRHSLSAVGISGIDGDLVTARKREPTIVTDPEKGEQKVDFGFVGDTVTTNAEVLQHLIDGGYIPVVCSLAADSDGQVLNMNADTLASQIAIALKAEKLCILGTVDGVMKNLDDHSSLYSVLHAREATQLISDKVAKGGMIPKLTTSLDALKGGVKQVHILNGTRRDTLLQEVFTNEGAGTMVIPDSK